ncbi:MAG: NrpR regulatory domain-containing protein [Planctomycetia bacterium]|nr:NrpR regulatory domain-containing protein [Planctomycetia bacterium]
MDIAGQRKISAILSVLSEAGRPVGSVHIAQQLRISGIRLEQRMVRYYLQEMDRNGYTENLGRMGRRITDRGRKELASAAVVDKVGFISIKVDELAYRMSYDLKRGSGTIIMNVSTIPASQFAAARDIIAKVIAAGLGMGELIAISAPGRELAGHAVHEDQVALGTVCSVTLNGVLGASGIVMTSRFGGLLELRDNTPFRFVQIINYDGTTLDPIEVFIKGRMTSVLEVIESGGGVIGASFREVPAAALPEVGRIIDKMARAGLGGVLVVGEPGQALLDIPVPHGRAGVIVAAGLNPLAAVEEAGIETSNRALARLFEFTDLTRADELAQTPR